MKALLLLCAVLSAFSSPLYAKGQGRAAPEFTVQRDIVYKTVGPWKGRMDMYLPPRTQKRTPVILHMHGGGWNHGQKAWQGGFQPWLQAGFAVVDIAYRLTPVAPAPAAIEDARCALMYVVQQSEALHLDSKKIVVMGSSAGGHLALMTGLLGDDHRFDNDCPYGHNVYVAAIIDKYGIADVDDWAYGDKKNKSAITWLGASAAAPPHISKEQSQPTRFFAILTSTPWVVVTVPTLVLCARWLGWSQEVATTSLATGLGLIPFGRLHVASSLLPPTAFLHP
jgi:acetyl esterase/lipase